MLCCCTCTKTWMKQDLFEIVWLLVATEQQNAYKSLEQSVKRCCIFQKAYFNELILHIFNTPVALRFICS